MGANPKDDPVLSAQSSPSADELHSRAAIFLRGIGLSNTFTLSPVSGGGNNRVYRLETAGKTLLLNLYFHHPGDSRDRFAAERAFYNFAWQRGVRRTPEPIAWDAEARLGL